MIEWEDSPESQKEAIFNSLEFSEYLLENNVISKDTFNKIAEQLTIEAEILVMVGFNK